MRRLRTYPGLRRSSLKGTQNRISGSQGTGALQDLTSGKPDCRSESISTHARFCVRCFNMMTIPATKARARLYALIDEAASSHVPIQITGKRANAILISEEDWSSIQETLFLLSVPGMRESIKAGLETLPEDCSNSLTW